MADKFSERDQGFGKISEGNQAFGKRENKLDAVDDVKLGSGAASTKSNNSTNRQKMSGSNNNKPSAKPSLAGATPSAATGRKEADAALVPTSLVQGRRKRKLVIDTSASDSLMRQELDELREWRRRVEENEKLMVTLFASSSSCIVCLDTRADLISYGACGHMVCIGCCLEHVTKKLMILRRPTQTTGCKTRLSYFALNPEDSEFSCPMCRQGQLDLMGAGLSLLPDFAYYQLSNYSATASLRAPPPSINSAATSLVAAAKASAASANGTTAASGAPSSSAPQAGGMDIKMLAGLSEGRRLAVLAQWEQNRLAAQKAAASTALTASTQAAGGGGLVALGGSIKCPFCGLCAAKPGAAGAGADRLLPTELLRHIWRCKKRTFRCGFADCKRSFSWESVYSTAPTSVAGDFKTESKWLNLVNAAFKEHMAKECLTQVNCCIGWCDSYKSTHQLPLCQFQDHENRHKLLHDRFQQIGSITDVAIQLERTLSTLLRSEFNQLPPPRPPNTDKDTKSASTGPATTPAATATAATGAATAAAGTVALVKPDVMTFAQPIAKEIHSSLDALNDLLRSYVVVPKGKKGAEGATEIIGINHVRCPHHGHHTNSSEHGDHGGHGREPRRMQLRYRSGEAGLDELEDELDLLENRQASRNNTDMAVFIDDENEDPEEHIAQAASSSSTTDDDDDEDFVPENDFE